MTEQAKLGERPAPRLRTEIEISHPHESGVIGYVCHDEVLDHKAAVMNRRRDEHFFVKHDGYAISDRVLDGLESQDVQEVYIHETHRGRLLEHDLWSFREGELVVYDRHQNTTLRNVSSPRKSARYDNQRVVPEENARVWRTNECELEL